MNAGDNLGDGKSLSLEEIRNTADAQVLIEIFRHGSNDECLAACDTIVRLLPVSKFEHLVDALEDPSKNVRRWSVRSLGRAGDPFFKENIVRMLKDESKEVREAAFCGLRDLVDANTLLKLISAEMHCASPKEKELLAKYLAEAKNSCMLVRTGLVDDRDLAELRHGVPIVVRYLERKSSRTRPPLPPGQRKTLIN